ncbi:MAG: helix-turn-helix domain-containing protein [Thermoguttaceae bacterium]|nr:helix-turn-helix domain-containing protein [Thermoguttaceae bacterium]
MYYTLEKTAEILDCTPGDVNRLREANKLRAFRDGASWKFRKEDVEKYLTDLIRERSKPAAPSAADLLNDSDDEELPTMLADSASFDAMIDATAETLEIKTNAAPEPDFVLDDASNPSEDDADLQIVAEPQAENDGLALEIESDDLQLVDEAPETDDADADLQLVDEAPQAEEDGLALETEDDDLQIVDENANAEDAGLALETESDDLQILDENADADLLRGDEAPQAEEDSASVFGLEQDDADALAGASDDDLLHLGSDSGLSLLDDVDLSGSNVSLDGGDVVLGGSGSGSGSGLRLGSDSGLSLLGDDAEDFALEGVELQNDAAFAPDADDDDSIFELADESKPAAVVELEQNADSDTATILGTGAEDFQLASDESTTYEVSESESASQSIEIAAEDDPFFTKDDDSASFAGFETSGDDANPFGGASDENPFASAVETPGDAFGGFGGNDDAGFGASSFDSPSADAGFGGDAEAAPVAARAPQTEYTGKDFLFLVPCFVFVLLATIGAYELCRTIWSYEEATFDISGPILDMIANAVGLTK